MLIEVLIFSLLAIMFFIIIFFKIIAKNDTLYVSFLVLQFIGIAIRFTELITEEDFGIYIKILTYIISVIIPISIYILEKLNINISERISITKAKIFGTSQKSKEILLNFLEKYPDSYLGHKMLAEIYEKEGGMRKSIDEYVKAIDINKKDYDSYYKIAEMLNELERKDEAVEMLTTLVRIKPEYYKASTLLGTLLCEQERFKEAISIFENSIKYDATNFDLYYNMGIAYTRLNDFQNAKKYFDLAAEINSEAYAIFYDLGILSLMFDNMEEAKKYFQEASKGTVVEAKAYYQLARISVINGERENSINYLNQAISIDGKFAKKAIDDNIFIPIRKYIHIPSEIKEEIDKIIELREKGIKAQEHLEKTYEVIGNLSKNELKNMNSFKEERIQSKEKNLEK